MGFPKDNAGKSLIAEKDLSNYDNYVKSLANRKPLAVLLYAPDFRDEYNGLSYARIYAPYYVFDNDSYPYDALISSDIGNQLIGGNIDSVYSLISTSGKPYSFNTHKQLSLSIDKTVETTSSQNIIGLVTGKDTSLPCIVFTAHHDDEGKINGKTYYGADDNGSGTTALLEIVRILGTAAKKGLQPKRTIVFVSTAMIRRAVMATLCV